MSNGTLPAKSSDILNYLLKYADFAPGIPSKTDLGDVLSLRADPGNIFVIQHHKALRAGPHYDIRIGNPLSGLLSWTTRKELPLPGEKPVMLFQQPLHRFSYGSFEGELPEGYGKGYVELLENVPIKVHDVSKDHILFSVESGKGINRYLITKKKTPSVHVNQKAPEWYIINVSPSGILPEKKKYKVVDDERVKELLKEVGKNIVSVQPKVDGAMSIITIKDGKLEVFSPRVSSITGRPIFHTERIFEGIPQVSVPKNLDDSILLGELYAVQKVGNKERILKPIELSALLNSRLSLTKERMKNENISFRIWLYDAVKLGKDDTDIENWYQKPYSQRRKFMDLILKYLPDEFHAPIEETTNQTATKLLETIKKQLNPYTQEGIVLFPEIGVPYKYKLFKEQDVYITGFTEGEGKYKGKGIGGITYSLTPRGKTVGVIGTGLSDELRQIMYENPEKFIGRRVRIKFQEQYPSGAHRMPVLIALHEDRP